MQKKLILNKRFGGYEWSRAGMLAVIEKKGFSDLHFFFDEQFDEEEEVTRDEFILSDPPCGHSSWVICIGDIRPNELYNPETYEEKLNNMIDCDGFGRDDPESISVLEELGSEYCSGKFACLTVEVFDDMDGLFDYYIDEYDGSESIVPYPYVTEDRVLQCATVEECLDLMRKIGVIAKPHDKEAMP